MAQPLADYVKLPELEEYKEWFKDILMHKAVCNSNNIYIAYQKQENEYCARSFEDAFINLNMESIKINLQRMNGLKNQDEFESYSNIYQLTDHVIDKKSDFASSILFLSHVNEVQWKTPAYIWEGLEWLQKQAH